MSITSERAAICTAQHFELHVAEVHSRLKDAKCAGLMCKVAIRLQHLGDADGAHDLRCTADDLASDGRTGTRWAELNHTPNDARAAAEEVAHRAKRTNSCVRRRCLREGRYASKARRRASPAPGESFAPNQKLGHSTDAPQPSESQPRESQPSAGCRALC